MFCPLIFEMSEVKIKKVDVASPPQTYRIYPGRRGRNDCYKFRGTQTSALPSVKEKRLPLVFVLKRCGNDPSAGSPTETLLRLHLPLNDEV